jgi:DNA-binding CsgD family transcriptional regulator
MTRLGAADLEAVLSLLEEAQTVEGPVPFTREVLDRLKGVVGCMYATYEETDQAARTVRRYVTCSAESDWIPDSPASDRWDCPRTLQLLRYRAADGKPFTVLANAFSRRQRTSTKFNGNYRDYGVADELQLDLDPTRRWFASLNLSDEHDFGPREKRMAELLRPHLAGLYRSAVLRRQLHARTATFDRDAVSQLTPRERDVMACVAKGLSNTETARALVIEVSTVRKHLENVYEKLGVRSRTAALAELRPQI